MNVNKVNSSTNYNYELVQSKDSKVEKSTSSANESLANKGVNATVSLNHYNMTQGQMINHLIAIGNVANKVITTQETSSEILEELTEAALCKALASDASVEMIESLIEKGARPTEKTLISAIMFTGLLEMVKMLVENGAPFSEDILLTAILLNKSFASLEIEKWLIKKIGLPLEAVLNKATIRCKMTIEARKEQLGEDEGLSCKALVEKIKLLIEAGVKPTSETLYNAIASDAPVQVIEVLIENSKAKSIKEILLVAKHIKISPEIINLLKNSLSF